MPKAIWEGKECDVRVDTDLEANWAVSILSGEHDPVSIIKRPAAPVIIAKKPPETQPSSIEPAKSDRPADRAQPPRIVQVSRPAPAAIHPSELPTPQKPAAPSIADSALEREHLQQQQQLRAQQEQERQRVQQQQELEHRRQAEALADAVRKQELERQHQLQTQQLQQKHIQEQQLLQAKQQEARQTAKPNDPHKRP